MRTTIGHIRQIIRESLNNNRIDESWKDKLKIVPFLAFALVTNACAQGEKSNPRHYHLEGFNEAEIQVIEAAAEEWCNATEGVDCLTFGEDGDSVIKVATVTDLSGDDGQCWKKSASGIITIKIADHRDNPNWLEHLHKVVRHEMGHSLQSHPQELGPNNAIAEYTEDTAPNITKRDIESLKADKILDPDANKSYDDK